MTLTVVKTTKGRIFGGFTAQSWESSEKGTYKKDPKAFLFSLDLQAIYPVREDTASIKCESRYGPVFGSGYDLCLD